VPRPLPSRQPPRARALTASARKLDESNFAYAKRLSQPWQLRALSYYDTIGEINFTSKFLARQISRVRFFPGRRLDDGTVEPIEDGPPVDLLNQLQDPGGGQNQLLYDYGRLMFVTGEGVLFGYDKGRKWRFLWKDEVRRREDGSWVRLDIEKKDTADVGAAYRFWAPHPRHSDEADGPMRAVQDICEELLLLTLAVRSTALTRLTNGVWVMPQEISPAPLESGMDEDPEQNPFMADWMEHVSNQIENPGSASARVPFVLEAAYDYLDRIRWIATHDPATDYMERSLREEAIKRLALSLDMSPEDLLGYTDANHWTGRQVQLDRWRMFGYNKAELWASSVCDAYLRPALEEEDYPDTDRVVIGFDDSQVVISPDRTEDALKAHNDGLISGKAARLALGWNEKDQLKGDERDEWLALKLRDPSIMGDEFMPPERGPMPNGNGPHDPREGPPVPGTNSGVSRQESRTASARVLGAAELALHRCRELAGVRVRHKCPDCADGQPLSLVASALGEKEAGDPVKLVSGGTDGFQEFLTGQGIEAVQAAAVCRQLEVFAARTLFEPRCPELPSGFVAAVEKAQEVSYAMAHQ
jgi:hypothetical protein